MAWLPRLDIIAGKLKGLTPFGTLDAVPGYLDNNFFIQGDGSGGTAQYDQMPWEDPTSWPGAYGSDMASVVSEARQSSLSNVLFAEIPVKNPDGATFYRHTINFYGDITCGHFQDEYFEGDALQFLLGRITRKVYADPNSPYVETELFHITPASAPTYNILIQGDEDQFPYAILRKSRMAFGFYTYEDTKYFGAFIYCNGALYNYDTDSTAGCLSGLSVDYLSEQFGVDFEDALEEIDDPNVEPEPDEPSGPGGGGGGGEGDHKLPDEGVPVPDLPYTGAASVNWLTVYKMSTVEINDFGQELIDPDVWSIIKSWFTNPLEAIVGITLIPVNVPTTRTKQPSVGGGITGYTWPNAYPVVTNEFYEVDCGTLHISPYWDSAFDFDPYTKFSLFLPFCGFKSIKADDIMGADIGVKYHINVMTGECTIFVTRFAQSESIYGPILPQVIGEYNGNCAVRVPIGRVSHDAAIDASMRLLATGLGMIGGAIAGQALGDPTNIGSSQVSNQISGATMTTVNGMKQSIERSGALGGSTGYMGNMRPYLIRSIPRQFLPDNYKRLNGYPANKGGTLGYYTGTGFQAVESIELDGLMAYDNEISEIISLLKGGVLV